MTLCTAMHVCCRYVQFGTELLPSLLFDVVSDPSELTNLAQRPEHQATVLAFAQKMLRWRMRHMGHTMTHMVLSAAAGLQEKHPLLVDEGAGLHPRL